MSQAITQYYGEVWLHHSDSPAEGKIWGELPSYLRSKVALTLTRHLVAAVPLFTGLQAELRDQICSRLTPLEVPPG